MNSLLERLRDDNPRKNDGAIVTYQRQGYILSIGLNAFSNERMIGGHPHKECLWFHATASKGSHLILCVHGREAPAQDVLDWAAELAIRNSKSEARTVSVSLLRNVYKPDGARDGVFKCDDYQTLEVPE